MKITNKQLKRIITEEVQKALKEAKPLQTSSPEQEKRQAKCPAGCIPMPKPDDAFRLPD